MGDVVKLADFFADVERKNHTVRISADHGENIEARSVSTINDYELDCLYSLMKWVEGTTTMKFSHVKRSAEQYLNVDNIVMLPRYKFEDARDFILYMGDTDVKGGR